MRLERFAQGVWVSGIMCILLVARGSVVTVVFDCLRVTAVQRNKLYYSVLLLLLLLFYIVIHYYSSVCPYSSLWE